MFANGFWNTYNAAFDNVKHVYEEQRKFDGVIMVDYYFKETKGKGYLVNATPGEAIIFNDQEGFIKVNDDEKIKALKPIRTNRKLNDFQILFNDITIDSFRMMMKDKAIKDLKVQATLPLNYSKDNEPQSSANVNISYIYNEVFKSSDVDSINPDIEKEISLAQLQLATMENEKKIFLETKDRLYHELTATKIALQSNDLADKEKAIKNNPSILRSYSSLQQPISTTDQLMVRLNYLKQKLHIKKSQRISGFISYTTFK